MTYQWITMPNPMNGRFDASRKTITVLVDEQQRIVASDRTMASLPGRGYVPLTECTPEQIAWAVAQGRLTLNAW